MEGGKDLSEMLKAKKSISYLTKTNNMVDKFKSLVVADTNLQTIKEFPKLRKPKESTLQKIKAGQKMEENASAKNAIGNNEDPKVMFVPLRQEFLFKKEQIEKATSDLLAKYDSRNLEDNMMLDDIRYESLDEPKPLTLFKDFNLQFDKLQFESCTTTAINEKPQKYSDEKLLEILTYPEHHLFRIVYTKVNAHPSGLFAENIPLWYKKTFDKDIDTNWMEILKKSNQFYIENIQNKTILYIKDEISEIDSKTTGGNITRSKFGKAGKIKPKGNKSVEEAKSPFDFLRYKHLQKSLQGKLNSASRTKFNRGNNDKTAELTNINKDYIKSVKE